MAIARSLLVLTLFATPLLAGGSPAPASRADVSITMPSTKIAAGAPSKFFVIQVHNAGPDPASGISVTFDLSGLDSTKLTLTYLSGPCLDAVQTGICHLDDPQTDRPLPAHGTITISMGLTQVGGTGPAGSIRLTLSANQDDPDQSDNVSTTSVEIAGRGADLVVLGQDVQFYRGAGGSLDWGLVNNGDETAIGLRYTAVVPRGVWFVDPLRECTYSADRRTATCVLPDLVLPPGMGFTPDQDAGMHIAGNITGPAAVTLTGGRVTAYPIRSVPADPAVVRAAKARDVDPGDNVFDFIVYALADPTATYPPTATRPPGNGHGLPATGSNAGLLALIGLTALAIGIALYTITRRRIR